MRQTKIVIKCDGLSVYTKDLGMGLSILGRLKEHGIMNHVEISIGLLDKANELLKGLCDKMQKHLSKQDVTKESNDSFEPALAISTRMEEPKNTEKILVDAIDKEALAKAFNDVIHKDKNKVKIDDIKVKAVVEEAIDEEAENNMDETVDESNAYLSWTKKETNILKKNLNASNEELVRLIPNRTLAAIKFKKLVSLGKIKSRRIKSKRMNRPDGKFIKWSKQELKALKANMYLKPKQLQKLPWLKHRTVEQINQKKCSMKKEMIARKAEESYED